MHDLARCTHKFALEMCTDCSPAQLYPLQHSNQVLFQFTRPLSVSSATPAVCPVGGGFTVDVRGWNFLNHSLLSCRFSFANVSRVGGASLAPVNATYVSSSLVRCQVPAGTGNQSGAMRLALSNNAQNYESDTAFALYDIASIVPSGGPETGGTRVVIRFNASVQAQAVVNASCVFGALAGGSAVPLRLGSLEGVSAGARMVQSAECVSPRLSGLRDGEQKSLAFSVSLNGRDFSASNWVFVYYAEARLDRVRPNSAPASGGPAITFIGQNFLRSAHSPSARVLCRFQGRRSAAKLLAINSTNSSNASIPSRHADTSVDDELDSTRRVVMEAEFRNGPRYAWGCPAPVFPTPVSRYHLRSQ